MGLEKSKGAITINDVARLAGVSKRTVSRVINHSATVNAETRAKIQAIIDQYDYAPSKQARGLASSRSYLVGMLSDDPNSIVIHSIQRGAISALSPIGYELVVHPLNHLAKDIVDNVLKFVARSNLDGLLILPPISMNTELLQALKANDIKFVALTAREVDDIAYCVVSSDRIAMQQVAECWDKTGVRRPGFIKGPLNRLSTKERYEGLVEALTQKNLSIAQEDIAVGDFSYKSGIDAAKTLLDRTDRPDAIFACNDQMAIATVHVAQDLGINIPDELQVIGYDDEPMAGILRPSLTTLRRSNTDMARAAGLKIVALINEEVSDAESYFLPQLIQRDSTRKPN